MKLPKNITPLLDGDWVVYAACSAIEYRHEERYIEMATEEGWWEDGMNIPDPSFQSVVDVFEGKVKEIKRVLRTKTNPIIFFTGPNNFRKEVAKTKVYKGTRKEEKPFFYEDLKGLIELRYATKVDDTLEADDLMSIHQTESPDDTCIVTVDKDLRQVNGWHYSPEGWNYPSFGPKYVTDENSYIEFKNPDKKGKGIVGTGYQFFWAQMLLGDSTDNIPGLPGHGPAAVMKLLEQCNTKGECFEAVRDAYRDVCWMPNAYMLEQGQLLWMVREIKDGKPVMWSIPNAPS